MDTFSRRVVGGAMGERPTAERGIDALDMAVRNRCPRGERVHHSDHGAPYPSMAFRRLEAARILGSMGSVGDALDNAVAESFFATLQTGRLNRGLLQLPSAPLGPGLPESGRVREEVVPPPRSPRYGCLATGCPRNWINSMTSSPLPTAQTTPKFTTFHAEAQKRHGLDPGPLSWDPFVGSRP
ncbi:transposase [Carboxydichorda subterranea]|uniref:transposase n=1 Tax=Carboxydichorda subterranea TaxID=3109565 RepID=UPI0038579766